MVHGPQRCQLGKPGAAGPQPGSRGPRLLRPAAKCLVLDLDNTLWGGVLGDDGAAGIKLGDDYPGNVFKDFQAALLGLRRRGFLLAIASKNDEQTVLDMLDSHPEMLLRREHFACDLRQLGCQARELAEDRRATQHRIGLAWYSSTTTRWSGQRFGPNCPWSTSSNCPPNRSVIWRRWATWRCSISRGCRPRIAQRPEMYRSETLRQQVAQQAGNVEDFLRDLEMVAQVGRANSNTLERIHQLIQKTNQFNLTTRRHNIDDLRRLAESPDAAVAWLRLADRYGDLGLVCVGIIERLDEKCWVIDTLLMSCRVMGRNVEDAFLSYLAELARAGGARRLRGILRPTAKNAPVQNFYPEHGFTELAADAEERSISPTFANGAFAWPMVIGRVLQEAQE